MSDILQHNLFLYKYRKMAILLVITFDNLVAIMSAFMFTLLFAFLIAILFAIPFLLRYEYYF